MNCPECTSALEQKEAGLEIDDELQCEECGALLIVAQLDPVVLEAEDEESDDEPDLIDLIDDDEEDDEEDEEDEEDDEEFEP